MSSRSLLALVTSAAGLVSARNVFADACVVRGKNAASLTLRVSAGEKPFQVVVYEAPMAISLDTPTLPAQVRVSGALSFDAVAPKGIEYRLLHPIELAGGAVRLGAGVHGIRLRGRDKDGDFRADIGPAGSGLMLRGVVVPCASLGIEYQEVGSPIIQEHDTTSWASRGHTLHVHSTPEAAQVVTLGVQKEVVLDAEEIQPNWVHIVTEREGITIDGWVR
jgi:hypothetical protein